MALFTLGDLKEFVEGCMDLGMDEETEVRIAHQPDWPFELSISEIIVHENDCNERECGYGCPCSICPDKKDCEDRAEEDDQKEEEKKPPVIYIAEGRQIGYLPGDVKEELGWR